LHFLAIVETLGQQIPSSSAASDKAIKMSFRLGESACCHAQFIAAMLTDGGLEPPSRRDDQVGKDSDRQKKDQFRKP
tara:strand:- start:529 stop:759 length:231 start_codon:yes stop_codon:yes gene_type:complete